MKLRCYISKAVHHVRMCITQGNLLRHGAQFEVWVSPKRWFAKFCWRSFGNYGTTPFSSFYSLTRPSIQFLTFLLRPPPSAAHRLDPPPVLSEDPPASTVGLQVNGTWSQMSRRYRHGRPQTLPTRTCCCGPSHTAQAHRSSPATHQLNSSSQAHERKVRSSTLLRRLSVGGQHHLRRLGRGPLCFCHLQLAP